MKIRAFWKHLGGGMAVYVIVAACAGSDSARVAHPTGDASVDDVSAADGLGRAFDSLVDPIPRAEAQVPPCTRWQFNVLTLPPQSSTPTNSDEWEPVGISTVDAPCTAAPCPPDTHYVLLRRCAP